jgi:hypothetical protein
MCSAQAQESGNHLFTACATAKTLTQQVFGWATRTMVLTVQEIWHDMGMISSQATWVELEGAQPTILPGRT